ncbi:MAG: hypothetical protein WCX81_06690 [Monoglobales bacterium]
MKNTKKLTFAAVASALSFALLYIASLVQTGTLAFQFMVGLILMVTVSKSGIGYGFLTYIVSSILCLTLLPDKSAAISYSIFFGTIPIVKYFAEKCSVIIEWIIKIFFMNIFLCGIYFVFRMAIGIDLPLALLWLGALIAAVLYDILLSYGFSYAVRYLKI